MKLLLCFIISMAISLTIHEIGHAFFSIVTRAKITGINIGVGPRIWRNDYFSIKLFPVAGNVECELNVSNKTGIIKMFLIAIGGCVFNGIMFIIGIEYMEGLYSLIFAFINVVMCISSLIPISLLS